MAAGALQSIHGHTLEELGVAIVAGRSAVGTSLPPEPQLCDEFGVSRTVMREAVKSLVAKGLLVTGLKVGLTREYLRDLQELRRVVEPAVVRLAAVCATAADIASIESAYSGMRRAIDESGDYVAVDLRYHQGLLSACHNRMLVQTGTPAAAALRHGRTGALKIRAPRYSVSDGSKSSSTLAPLGSVPNSCQVPAPG